MLDEKLEKILLSLDIEFDNKTVDYKQLRRHFIDLYLLRFEFIRNLINETGRTDDDFKREVEEKLKVELFPELKELTEKEINSKLQVSESILGSNRMWDVDKTLVNEQVSVNQEVSSLSKLQSTPISKVIEKFFDDKVSGDIRGKSEREIKHSLGLLVEGLGEYTSRNNRY